MSEKTIIEHPDFGLLTNPDGGEFWESSSNIAIELFNNPYRLRVELLIDSAAGLQADQIEAFKVFEHDRGRILQECEDRLKDYALELVQKCDGGETKENILPIENNVEPISIFFPYSSPVPTLGILLECKWDVEHGLAVKIVDGQISEIGTQDIII